MEGETGMKIYTLAGGDEVHRFDRSILVSFSGRRKVLSTGPLHGGYRTDLTGALNHDGNYGRGCLVEMKADTYRGHMRLTLQEIGLPEETTAGLETAAQMENASIVTESFRDLSVTAITTAGIEASGGRVGDPASWYEEKGEKEEDFKPGTINTILHINADLYEGTLARALVTATEAKTAALQELLAPSLSSDGIATGSGTDGIIVIANAESDHFLTDAGKFSKLGELIGKTVKLSVKEALFLQNGLGPDSQHSIIKRMSRFGVTEAGIYQRLIREYGQEEEAGLGLPRHLFSDRLQALDSSGTMVGLVSCIAHLLDQYNWGMLKEDEVRETVTVLFSLLGYKAERNRMENEKGDKEGPIPDIVMDFERLIIERILADD